MNDLESRVLALSYDDLVEAANFYLPEATGVADLQDTEERLASTVEQRGGEYRSLEAMLREVRNDPSSVAYLLRAVLLHAAHGTVQEQQRLTESLDGVGKSQVVVEVMYAIYASAALGMVWLAIPPMKHTVKIIREKRADGSEMTTEEIVDEEIPPPLDKLFGWIKTLMGGSVGEKTASQPNLTETSGGSLEDAPDGDDTTR